MLSLLLVLAALVPLIVVFGRAGQKAISATGGGGEPRRSRRLTVAVVAALALVGTAVVAPAQQSAATGSRQDSSSGGSVQASGVTVSGRVTDASGDGIQDVQLKLSSWHAGYGVYASEGIVEGNTGSDGSYTLGPFDPTLPASTGSHDLVYLIMEVAAPDNRFADTVVPLEILTAAPVRLDIVLGPGGRISVRLKDPDGRPVASHRIYLCRDWTDFPWTRAATARALEFFPFCRTERVQSNASGGFEFRGVAAGGYVVRAAGRFLSEASVVLAEGGHERVEFEVVPWDYEFEGRFIDDEGSVHEGAIDALAGRGILLGTECGSGRFCPGEAVTREVMAVWLGRALAGGEPPPVESSRFADVDPAGRHASTAAHIERFAELGVTAGCRTGPLRFCPDEVVTRAQMATFLRRALSLDVPEAPAGFVDVDAGSVHAGAIDALRASGITAGCGTGPLRFCPDQPVKRAEMATFIDRALAWLDEVRENLQFFFAADIGLGDRVEAELAPGGRSYFRFEASAGQGVEIETHGDLDLVVSLRRVVSGAPDEVLDTDDDGGVGVNSLIGYSVTAAGWYIIEVRGFDSAVAGDYEISLSLAEEPA